MIFGNIIQKNLDGRAVIAKANLLYDTTYPGYSEELHTKTQSVTITVTDDGYKIEVVK